MTESYLTYEAVLRELQIEDSEMERLILDGSLHRIDTDEGPRFLKAQVEAIKDDMEAMKTIVLDKKPGYNQIVGRDPHPPSRGSPY
jgi:hypothetical protein